MCLWTIYCKCLTHTSVVKLPTKGDFMKKSYAPAGSKTLKNVIYCNFPN